jgi:transposase-like protein
LATLCIKRLGPKVLVPQNRRKLSLEFKDEAVKSVIMNSRPIAHVAREFGINEGTLGNWVATYPREKRRRGAPLYLHERVRLREAEVLVRGTQMENEFLKK